MLGGAAGEELKSGLAAVGRQAAPRAADGSGDLPDFQPQLHEGRTDVKVSLSSADAYLP